MKWKNSWSMHSNRPTAIAAVGVTASQNRVNCFAISHHWRRKSVECNFIDWFWHWSVVCEFLLRCFYLFIKNRFAFFQFCMHLHLFFYRLIFFFCFGCLLNAQWKPTLLRHRYFSCYHNFELIPNVLLIFSSIHLILFFFLFIFFVCVGPSLHCRHWVSPDENENLKGISYFSYFRSTTSKYTNKKYEIQLWKKSSIMIDEKVT